MFIISIKCDVDGRIRIPEYTGYDLPKGTLIVGAQTWQKFYRNPKVTGKVILVSRTGADSNFDEAVDAAVNIGAPIYVIGGIEIFNLARVHQLLEKISITKHERVLWSNPRGDVIFSSRAIDTRAEDIYLRLVMRVLAAPLMPNRTRYRTHAVFGARLTFPLCAIDGKTRILPALTTRRLFLRGVWEELLFFLRADINVKTLNARGIHIWDIDTTREALDRRGLHHYEVGTIGPAYGCQWRNWGGDQLGAAIEKLKVDPYARDILVSAWNVSDLDKMALPPCHFAFQFMVEADERLSIAVMMRSADLPLGVPFNLASYGFLAHIVSHIIGRAPGRLYLTMNNCHIYENQVDAMLELLKRSPLPSPTLTVPEKIKNIDDAIDVDFKEFKMCYRSRGAIKINRA